MWPKVIILLPLLLASGVTATTEQLPTTSSSQSTTLGTTTEQLHCSFDGGIYWTGDKLEDSCLILECVGDTWQPTGSISNNCSMCSLRNDPHFTGFYGYTYDFHGFLEYYIAMDIDAYGVIGDFHPCNAFASCLDIITYKDDADTIITFDKDDGNSILVNGEPFAVNNVVQNVQSAGGVVHPVLAWKQGGCIRVVGTRRIAVSFCIHDMYIWAENAILGDLAGLCFGGRDFGFKPAGRFQRLPASQWDIDEWGQSLQVSGNNTGPLETTTVPPILECVTEDEQIYFECQGLFGETSASDGLHEAAVDFCKVDLCAMTLSGANQVEIDAWKTKMVVMLDNTIEVINNTLPPDHPQTTEAPTTIGYPPTEDPIIEYPDFTTIGYPPTGAPTNCTFDGKMYSNGEKIGISCLVLECVGGTWEPTGSINNTCSMCSIRNDPHFIDFFAWAFDFHGTGSYKIARNVNEIGVTGEFYQCFPFISCLDTITYRDNPGTVITFDRNHVNKISVNGFLFDVTDVVQNVQSAGGVVHPVLAWKHGYYCIRIIGTQGIAVAFCGWEMYVWAQDAILGDLEGLCLADPKFELGDAPRDFTFLPVSQEDIDAWGNEVQEPLTRPAKRSAPVTDVSSTCDDALEEELLQECLDLLGGASYEGHNPRSALLTVAAQFCKVDLCALTQDNATQQAIDEWKDIMVDMMENTVEIIVRTPPKEEPQDHEEESHKGFDIKIQVIQEVNV